MLTDIGDMTLEVAFGDLHTLDVGPWVPSEAEIQGILLTVEYQVVIEGEPYAVLRCSGLTRQQLQRATDGLAEEVAAELGIARG